MANEELQSQTITFLRFPMMVGGVLIHAHIYEVVVNGINLLWGKFAVYQTVVNLVSRKRKQSVYPCHWNNRRLHFRYWPCCYVY